MPIFLDNYGGSADQLDCYKMVTYNDRAKLGSDTKRGVSYNCCGIQATELWYQNGVMQKINEIADCGLQLIDCV